MTKRTVELELATPGLDAQGQPSRVPLTVEEPDLGGEHLLINIGPQHPATHGVLRLVVELDGEVVVRVIPHVGYLHSGFEKLGEYRHYNQIIPLTDRTDYLSPMANNVGFALAVERLMGIEITPRCTVLRVIACEMSRIISHLVWLGTTGIDLGAFTPFLWAFQQRERVYNLQEMWTGARLTTSLTRVGGLMADIPDGFVDGLRNFTQTFPDMYPLTRQVQTVCDFAMKTCARLTGSEVPQTPDTEKSFEELQQRIAKATDYVKSFKPAQFDGGDMRDVTFPIGPSNTMTLKGQQYLTGFAFPNFYFHAATAHGILRHNGVEIGKRDFLGVK